MIKSFTAYADLLTVYLIFKKSWSFEEPKIARNRRTVYLPASLLQKLATHKGKQSEVRLKLGTAWQAFDLIFFGEQGTPHSIPNLTSRYFRPILEKAEPSRIKTLLRFGNISIDIQEHISVESKYSELSI